MRPLAPNLGPSILYGLTPDQVIPLSMMQQGSQTLRVAIGTSRRFTLAPMRNGRENKSGTSASCRERSQVVCKVVIREICDL